MLLPVVSAKKICQEDLLAQVDHRWFAPIGVSVSRRKIFRVWKICQSLIDFSFLSVTIPTHQQQLDTFSFPIETYRMQCELPHEPTVTACRETSADCKHSEGRGALLFSACDISISNSTANHSVLDSTFIYHSATVVSASGRPAL